MKIWCNRKECKYRKAYDGIGVNHKVSENYANFDDTDFQDVNSTILANFLAVSTEESTAQPIRKVEKESKPRVMDSIDDEVFEFGPIQKGPIQYVRMDEEYMRNLIARNRIPQHLDSKEKVYFEDEISERREQVDDVEELKKLIRRKRDEIKIWEQRVATVINRRQYDEQIAKKKEELRLMRERESLLRNARKKLVEAAENNEDIVAEKLRELEERQAARAAKEAEAAEKRAARAGKLTVKQQRAKARRHRRYLRDAKEKAKIKAKEKKQQERLERKEALKAEKKKLAKKMKQIEK